MILTDMRAPQPIDGPEPAQPADRGLYWQPPARRRWGVGTLLTAIRRRPRLFLGLLGAMIALGGLVLLLAPPRYVATAEVVLDTTTGMRRAAPDAAETQARAQTELRILRSREMARAVSTMLRLPFETAFVRESTGMFGTVPTNAAARERLVLDRLQAGLAAEPLAGTYSLAIGFAARDPQRAAQIATAYARAYSTGRLAGADGAAARPGARLISEAEPPLVPDWPRPVPVMALALALGLGLGTLAAAFAEARFAGLTSSADVEARLGLIHLGSVPTLDSVLPDARDPIAAVAEAPLSAFAESFRNVFMTMRHVGGRGTQVFAFTSALPGEGKTTMAACLARSIALAKESVVLVDADPRHRAASALFVKDPARPGLAQLLRYEATLEEVLIRDEVTGAWILPITGPPVDLSELIGGQAMAAVIEDLRRRFKRVLIDTAPLLPVTATRAIATMADLTAIVVRWRQTSDHAVIAALRLLPARDVRLGGAILSRIDLRETGKYGQDDATFYYKQYSKYYS